ncbi:acyl-ACP--UDP-N-acetylglucosamine O-acyltransferase [Anaeromyxobacter dehalogenans]|uniref:Acyl-[acyl-carrier-protein]--UDP-N-acetylglucosamine O-acyltransferase n=2 Tax=Anaeromyxobacter dehalogenans TaxID=161493 RepID=LPXA_ANADE|nr:acyl-ACP--UDP-N-acetylglucosamine O-acyltransferase [Anaeromyxobacter dehalogenans]B8JFW9.1 RecName: Full=Acyl-[acyl-carrier-protein]--UDP-N-acetylglucosamine O-acyltransferase; Short=UDP-N-acetylglucosamine acyltransferase [Anaeromyxobacter dehalogenans 2CP-1]Q2IPX7.1 RecName: Full=Acyl-[acyl-carrier-protein]--UDP-N-acetylglucosamine O-acyltransferase; Short=UDP-N-acetylglucosamine acyltransferase [Anaeromyxobacter dehalogenans 2CP-C]ABC80860.1 acyl-[acyl-carrier-protein]--UDP-N-acetylglucos
MAIHPTAIVEAGAQVDPSCDIGPYAVIGPLVRMGPGNSVGAHAVVTGRTTLGASNRIFPHAVIGGIPQDLKYRGEDTALVIGDRNTFREFATVNLGTAGGGGVTRIGSGGLFMASSHIGHDCQVGDGAIIANSVAIAGHVLIEDHVHFGGLSASHQFCRVGRLAFVGGMTGVAMDVAPYCTVAGARGELAGLNTIGMQRAGMTEEQVGRVKQAYKIVFRSSLGLAEAIAQLEAELAGHPETDHFIAFLKGSQRGITR